MFHTEALRLEELLAGHGVAARVGPATLGTDAIRFPVQLGLGATTRRLLSVSRDLAHEAGYARCRLRREGPTLFLELPRDGSTGLRYGDLLAISGQPPADSALLGMMDSGASIMFSVDDPAMQHLLVTGEAGSGKSNLLRVLALGLASHQPARFWRLALLESRPNGPLAPLHPLPHCWAWSARAEHAVGWLVRLVTEMVEREAAGRTWPRVLAVVDDVEPVLVAGGGVARAVLKALLTRGATVGLHLALACQAEGGLGDLATLIPARLTGGGALLPGRFTLHDDEVARPVLAARLDEAEVVTVVQRMRAQRIRVVARPAGEDVP